jgi:hypothetical protein
MTRRALVAAAAATVLAAPAGAATYYDLTGGLYELEGSIEFAIPWRFKTRTLAYQDAQHASPPRAGATTIGLTFSYTARLGVEDGKQVWRYETTPLRFTTPAGEVLTSGDIWGADNALDLAINADTHLWTGISLWPGDWPIDIYSTFDWGMSLTFRNPDRWSPDKPFHIEMREFIELISESHYVHQQYRITGRGTVNTRTGSLWSEYRWVGAPPPEVPAPVPLPASGLLLLAALAPLAIARHAGTGRSWARRRAG